MAEHCRCGGFRGYWLHLDPYSGRFAGVELCSCRVPASELHAALERQSQAGKLLHEALNHNNDTAGRLLVEHALEILEKKP